MPGFASLIPFLVATAIFAFMPGPALYMPPRKPWRAAGDCG